MNIKYFAISIAAYFLVVPSCKKPETGDGADTVAGKEVSFTPDRKTNLRNPLCGWVLYNGIGEMNYDFFKRYESMSSSEGQVDVTSYANTILVRTSWAALNPEEGVYAWQESCNTPVAKYYRWLVGEAKARGMRIGFGYGIDDRDKHEPFTPPYVRAKGAKGYETKTGSYNGWTPFPDDPVFQKCYEKFIHDFAQEINDPEHYEFVHGVGIGKWGEYHNCIYSTGDETNRGAVIDWVSTLFTKEFTKIPTFINYHRLIGSMKSDGAADPLSEGFVDQCVKKGMSIGSGAFGMGSYFGTWEKGIALKYQYKRPVVAEGGWVKTSHGDAAFKDPHGYKTWSDVRQGEYNDAIACSANCLDFRYSKNVEDSETYSWFNDAFDLVRKFISEGTYRLYPQKVTVPETAKAGAQVTINHRWTNLGQAYCPTNIPQFKDKYKVAFALLDPSNEKPVAMYYDEQAQPCDWYKNKPVSYSFKIDLKGVKPGKYIWATGIVDDASADRKIGIYIAVKGDFTADNWLKISDVTIQ